jgi:hypothetical protein
MKRLTIRQWLNILESPVREQAIKNALHNYRNNLNAYPERNTLASAINSAFVWDSTPEGQHFWSNLYHDTIKMEHKLLKG